MENIRKSQSRSKAIDQVIDRFVKLFETRVNTFPEMLDLIESVSSLEHHTQLMRAHLEKTYGDIEALEAFELSHHVGQSHINHEVRLSWYLTTYITIFEAYHASQKDCTANLPDLKEFRETWLRDAGDTLDSNYELLVQQHIRERRHLQESINELDIQAKTDPLTEILNRRGFRNELDKTSEPGLFILFDLDNFKSVNDLHGHIVGDEILKKVGRGLASELRKGDLVGRIGGDEFSVWLPAPVEMTTCEIKTIVNRMLASISFDRWNIGISGGIVLRPNQADTFDELYAKADSALYQAKLNGPFSLVAFGNDQVIDITP
ncbi:MAG: GGDEF domain-containing protein [Actinomycetota bacterium]|nr:GGDEF domain-containing protein [Actinomycetota bacterium]